MKIRDFGLSLRKTVIRFPIASVLLLLFYMIAATPIDEKFFLLVIGPSAFLAIAVSLLGESRSWNLLRKSVVTGLVTALIFAFISVTSLTKESSGFFALCSIAFLSIFIAPFLSANKNDNSFWLFGCRLSLRIIQGLIICLVLFLGGLAIYASLNYLFGMALPEKSVLHIWLFMACLVGPFYTMTGIPDGFEDDDIENIALVKAQCIVQAYIVVPLMIVYAAILYAYAVMIGIQAELPKGGVANIVTAFAAIGTIVFFTAYGVRKTYSMLDSYIRFFFKLLILPLILLAVAIIVRIDEYGITEERYYVMLGLVFFTGTAAIDFISKNRKLIPVFSLLLALLLISIIPPFSASYVSLKSQSSRLEIILTENGFLKNGKLQKSDQEPSFKTRKQISSILDYLSKRKKLGVLKEWTSIDRKSTPTSMMAGMGLIYLPKHMKETDTDLFYFDRYSGLNVNIITGYDEISNISITQAVSTNFKFPKNKDKLPIYRSIFFSDLKEIHVYKGEKKLLVFDISAIENKFPTSDQEFSLLSRDKRGKILVRHMSGNRKNGKNILKSLEGLLLTRKENK